MFPTNSDTMMALSLCWPLLASPESRSHQAMSSMLAPNLLAPGSRQRRLPVNPPERPADPDRPRCCTRRRPQSPPRANAHGLRPQTHENPQRHRTAVGGRRQRRGDRRRTAGQRGPDRADLHRDGCELDSMPHQWQRTGQGSPAAGQLPTRTRLRPHRGGAQHARYLRRIAIA